MWITFELGHAIVGNSTKNIFNTMEECALCSLVRQENVKCLQSLFLAFKKNAQLIVNTE